MKFFAGLEADGFYRGDADFSAGARVAADTGLAGTDAEDSESTQLDAVAGSQSLLEPFKNGVDRSLGFGTRETCPFNDVMHDVLLDQCLRLGLGESFPLEKRTTGAMLLGFGAVVNGGVLQWVK